MTKFSTKPFSGFPIIKTDQVNPKSVKHLKSHLSCYKDRIFAGTFTRFLVETILLDVKEHRILFKFVHTTSGVGLSRGCRKLQDDKQNNEAA